VDERRGRSPTLPGAAPTLALNHHHNSTFTRDQPARAEDAQGSVATDAPLATAAAVEVLRRGGSAVDAAIAANAVLGVIEPMNAGIGGDVMALVYNPYEDEVVGLNGAGKSPQGLSREEMEATNLNADGTLRVRGPLSVNVPGAVAAWWDLHQRFGRLPWADLFKAAIDLAFNGFEVSEHGAKNFAHVHIMLNATIPGTAEYTRGPLTSAVGQLFLDTFAPFGEPPRAGDWFSNPALANTLAVIAKEGAIAFYNGGIASDIVNHLRSVGGRLSRQDLAQHRSELVRPVHVDYQVQRMFGPTDTYRVYTLPPSSQGAAGLQILQVMQRLRDYHEAFSAAGDELVNNTAEAVEVPTLDTEQEVTAADSLDRAMLSDDSWFNSPQTPQWWKDPTSVQYWHHHISAKRAVYHEDVATRYGDNHDRLQALFQPAHVDALAETVRRAWQEGRAVVPQRLRQQNSSSRLQDSHTISLAAVDADGLMVRPGLAWLFLDYSQAVRGPPKAQLRLANPGLSHSILPCIHRCRFCSQTASSLAAALSSRRGALSSRTVAAASPSAWGLTVGSILTHMRQASDLSIPCHRTSSARTSDPTLRSQSRVALASPTPSRKFSSTTWNLAGPCR